MEKKREKAIIIDTNFWLVPFEKKVDLLGQLEKLAEYAPFKFIVPMPVLNELKMMAGGGMGAKKKIPAKAALAIIEKLAGEGRAQIYEIGGKADGAIISCALQTGGWVATNDRSLRMRLKEKKIKVILLKDEHILAFF